MINDVSPISVPRHILVSCAEEIRNLRAKLGAGEQEGWEGTRRRDSLLSALDKAVTPPVAAAPLPLSTFNGRDLAVRLLRMPFNVQINVAKEVGLWMIGDYEIREYPKTLIQRAIAANVLDALYAAAKVHTPHIP